MSLAVIPAGQLTASVTVAPVADNVVEAPETAVLTLASNAAYAVGPADSATVTIADDPPVVEVVASDAIAAEPGGDTGAFTFTRRGGNIGQALTAGFTRTGTALMTSDYQTIPSSVTLPAGQASTVLTITPIDDVSVEGTETVTLTLTASGSVVVGAQGSATVTIADND